MATQVEKAGRTTAKSNAQRVRPPAGKRSEELRNLSVTSARTASDPESRYALISEAAYFRAERRGFESGYELEDWLEAEAEVDRKLSDWEKARTASN